MRDDPGFDRARLSGHGVLRVREGNGFITNADMEDGGGHQMAHIEYPGLPTDYVMEMVHRFYDEYYFRPKAAFRVVWKAIVNRDVPRLYVEAKSFLKLRAQRNRR